MSVDVALTSFLMRNFPDQYLFVLQYWVSSSAISKKIFDLVSREANLKTDKTQKNCQYMQETFIQDTRHNQQLIVYLMYIVYDCDYFPPKNVSGKLHSCMWPLSSLMCRDWRQTRNVGVLPGPGPPQAETH